jgi:hypothetical protein
MSFFRTSLKSVPSARLFFRAASLEARYTETRNAEYGRQLAAVRAELIRRA